MSLTYGIGMELGMECIGIGYGMVIVSYLGIGLGMWYVFFLFRFLVYRSGR
jgi:hypothetical protein